MRISSSASVGSKQAYREAFIRYALNGERELGRFIEKRDVQADVDLVGGYLIMPQLFVQTLIKFTDNLLWLRQLATKFQLPSAQSLGAPVLDSDPDDSDWTSELATGNVDAAFAFGKRELVPYPLAKRLKASNRLLRMASISNTFSVYDAESGNGPVENFLMSRLAYKTAVPQEKAFMTGNGVNQPLGLFTASNRGISTGRDVSTGSQTGITSDALISTKYSLKQQYHKTAKWLFSREAIKRIRQLKDSYGQYLWQPGLQAGAPDMLLECPLMMSEYCPSTFTNTSYVGMLADFSFYWIADSLEYQIQKLVELYAEANQTGFIVRCELDGMPVLEEAFARLQCS
jgi:HK97 family phage major capsid protein